MLSDKCPRASNAFSCEPRGSQLPPPRRSVPGVSPALWIGGSWAPRHREVVGRALLSCSLIFGADMIECR